MPSLKIAVAGAAGRMGQAVIRAIAESHDATLSGALERQGASDLGREAGEAIGFRGIKITDDPKIALAGAEAVIDFSTPESSLALAKLAARHALVHVVGTTGLTPAQLNALKRAGQTARIVQSGNMSLGVNLLASLVERAAASLDGYDIEILELHHRMKVDAPSGTALLLGESAAKGRNVKLDKARLAPRDGMTGARKRGAIGFASLRGGTVVGEHRVILAGEHERIELTHVAEDRSIFAQGALRAALWAADQKPGFYSIADVLGVK